MEFVRAAQCILGSDTQTLTRKSIQVVLDNYDNLAFPAWVVGKDLKTEKRGEYYLPNLGGEFSRDAVSNVEQMTVAKIDTPAPAAVMMAPTAIGETLTHEFAFLLDQNVGAIILLQPVQDRREHAPA